MIRSSSFKGSQKGDVYAFAIIVHEMIGRKGPFAGCGFDDPKGIRENCLFISRVILNNIKFFVQFILIVLFICYKNF